MEKVVRFFESAFVGLQTDCIDIGMIHYVDSEADWDLIVGGGIMDYAQELKSKGRIRAVGISSHNPLVALRAVESGLIDVLLFAVNPCYDLLPADEDCETLWADESYSGPLTNMDKDREQLYEKCQRLGIGMNIMKAFGGGDLLTADSPAGKALTAAQCLSYALTRPAAAAVMAGAASEDEISALLEYETAPASRRDYAAALASFPRMSWKGHCMYCGHCAPCPSGIDVAAVTKFYNLARAQGFVPETVRGHYRLLSAHAGDCIGCGACETRCPFGVSVRENMTLARDTFGF
jgi:predicted aldo/keto reductase-like oxidoreductase